MLEPWLPIQQGPGQPRLQKNIMIFQCITVSVRERWRPDRNPLFCPAARFAVLDTLQNEDRLIASREYGLY
jgi:hypothetical protein